MQVHGQYGVSRSQQPSAAPAPVRPLPQPPATSVAKATAKAKEQVVSPAMERPLQLRRPVRDIADVPAPSAVRIKEVIQRVLGIRGYSVDYVKEGQWAQSVPSRQYLKARRALDFELRQNRLNQARVCNLCAQILEQASAGEDRTPADNMMLAFTAELYDASLKAAEPPFVGGSYEVYKLVRQWQDHLSPKFGSNSPDVPRKAA